MHITFSRSGSSKVRARLLLSITEDAATSKGVEPLMAGQAVEWKAVIVCLIQISISVYSPAGCSLFLAL